MKTTFSLLLLLLFSVGVSFGNDAPIYRFDVSAVARFDAGKPEQVRQFWDTLHLVVSLQGIVNKNEATLFLRAKPSVDDFWWDELRKEGNWLADRPVVNVESLDELLKIFAPRLNGAVVYGEKPWSLSNVASTVAGVENRVCLRFDADENSVYQKTLRSGLDFVKPENTLYLCDPKDGGAIFTGVKGEPLPKITPLDKESDELLSVGSAKCDAYLWAKRNYLDTRKVSRQDMCYYLDSYWLTMPTGDPWNSTIGNHDFTISRSAFFFELHCWGDEAPVDDPNQPLGTDLATTKAILKSMHKNADGGVIEIHGFTPWPWKYTSYGQAGSKHEPVPTEWESVRIFSAYNAYIDADAIGYSALANGSFYQHFPMQDHYPQSERPTLETLKKRGLIDENGQVVPKSYMMFYMGDYDSAPWLATMVPVLWNDPARGTIPCNWAFNPNLEKRAPHVLDYVRKNATKNDWFISGDSGAGYLNPGMLTAPRLDPEIPDGWDVWTEHNLRYFRKYDLDIAGFVIDGYAPAMGERGLKEYAKFSPRGMIGHAYAPYMRPTDGMFTIPMRHDLYGDPPKAGKELSVHFVPERKPGKPHFMPIRTILKTPSWHKEVMEETIRNSGEENVEFLDVYSFFLLMGYYVTNNR
ncbi:MAG: hypothetical protein FWC43_02430 [Planctomycetaceae bacterium]|nr:hypothetical protein [Planctomycetaceae bacterium]